MTGATFEAFDGVEITLLGGRVVHAPCLTLAEATAYARVWAKIVDGSVELVPDFVDAFVSRVGLDSATLAELGVELEDAPDDLTAEDVRELVGALSRATWDEDARKQSEAQLRWLDLAPKKLGAVGRAKLAAMGQAMAAGYYGTVFRVASDFCSRLHLWPKMETWEVRRPPRREPATSPAGMPT